MNFGIVLGMESIDGVSRRINHREVIAINDNLLANEKAFKNPWVYRETVVMKRLREYLKNR